MNCKLFAYAVTALLTACGGGGGGAGSSDSAISLSGNVSQGFPIGGAQVTLIDANGKSLNGGTTDSTGAFSVSDISGLQLPVLVSASGVSGGTPLTMYGMLTAKQARNIANVTPMTDAVVTLAIGSSPSLLLNTPNAVGAVDVSKVNLASAQVATVVSNVLNQITPGASANFNPLSTAFNANGVTAADKINDLVKVSSAITPTGVTTDITDKSNGVGTVTITAGSNATALPPLSSKFTGLDLPSLNAMVTRLNNAFSSGQALDSQLPDLIASDYLDNGLDKSGQIKQFTVDYRSEVIGVKLFNPKVIKCDNENVCLILMSGLFQSGAVNKIDAVVKYYPNLGAWLMYGNQFKYEAQFSSSLNKYVNNSNISSPSVLIRSSIQFGIQRGDAGTAWNNYQSARVSLQSVNSTPDLTYNFVLKPSVCSPTAGLYYDGMPLDIPSDPNNSNKCDTWRTFDAGTESLLKTINNKIKKGGYIAKFEAWKNYTRSGAPDVSMLPIFDQILIPDSIGDGGFPLIKLVQPTTTTLPYLQIDNADDFIISGTVCITSQNGCDNNSLKPKPFQTSINPNGNIKLPKRFEAKPADGWPIGQKAGAYFVHVIDKAGRDMTIYANEYK